MSSLLFEHSNDFSVRAASPKFLHSIYIYIYMGHSMCSGRDKQTLKCGISEGCFEIISQYLSFKEDGPQGYQF